MGVCGNDLRFAHLPFVGGGEMFEFFFLENCLKKKNRKETKQVGK